MHLYVSCATPCGSGGGGIGRGRMPSDTAWLLLYLCCGKGAGLCQPKLLARRPTKSKCGKRGWLNM